MDLQFAEILPEQIISDRDGTSSTTSNSNNNNESRIFRTHVHNQTVRTETLYVSELWNVSVKIRTIIQGISNSLPRDDDVLALKIRRLSYSVLHGLF